MVLLMEWSSLQQRLRTRMAGIEMLRALAILAVLLQNRTSPEFGIDDPFARLWALISGTGWSGVQLFFVISGFLITGILIDSEGKPGRWRNFIMRRVLRIFPLYFGFLAFFYLLLPALDALPAWLESSRSQQIWFWAYLVNWVQPYTEGLGFGHLWSLAIEEQFYLVWPWLVILLPRRRMVALCLLLIVSAPLFRILLSVYDPHWVESAYTFTFARWDALALGALLACLLRSEPAWQRLRSWVWPLFLLLSGLMASQLLLFHEFRAVTGTLGLLNQTTVALWSALLLILVLRVEAPQGTGWKVRLGRLLMRIGKYSYAIYLVHLPIKIWWIDAGHAWLPSDFPVLGVPAALLANFFSVLLMSMAVAALTWQWLEAPFLRLKRHFQ